MSTETFINDIVLIYYEGNPLAFARIESIDPDIKRGWYHVKLLLLQIPLRVVTWILRDVYINGEVFTMDGKEMRLERVVSPPDEYSEIDEDDKVTLEEKKEGKPEQQNGKVISLSDLKKK